MITPERLRELLEYDPESGLWTWIGGHNNKCPPGKIAGTIDKGGYVVIQVEGRFYKAHRLAWLYMTGELPREQVDHINLVKADNRWVNLREATHAQNMANRKVRSASGYKGVVWNKSAKKWQAQLRTGGKHRYLGIYTTKEEAHAAWCEAAEKSHGDFYREQ